MTVKSSYLIELKNVTAGRPVFNRVKPVDKIHCESILSSEICRNGKASSLGTEASKHNICQFHQIPTSEGEEEVKTDIRMKPIVTILSSSVERANIQKQSRRSWGFFGFLSVLVDVSFSSFSSALLDLRRYGCPDSIYHIHLRIRNF